MNILKSYSLIIIALFILVSYSYSHANEVEEKFIKAGLVDIYTVDESIKIDLVNSDPAKTFFGRIIMMD